MSIKSLIQPTDSLNIKKSSKEISIMSSNELVDNILRPNPKRFTLFPIKYNDIWKMYKTAENSFWVAEELKLDTDLDDWNNKLNDNERYYIKHVLAFFANADGIVNENLIERFCKDVTYLEAQYFYNFQMTIENIHAEAYGIFINTYIQDEKEREHLFNSIETIPCVEKKAKWAMKWIESKNSSFGERLLAFACVEGIFFSGSFAAIFWLRKRGLLKGLSQANTLISRDEGLHQKFACMLYRDHLKYSKPSVEKALEIVKEACEIEKEFQVTSIPCSMIGMNGTLMEQYIEFVADHLLQMVALPKIYNVQNPFDFMDMISLDVCENFFEEKGVNYSMAQSSREFALDEEF